MKSLVILCTVCAVGLAASEGRSVACGEFWPSLAEMTPTERANSQIWLEPAPSSASEAYGEARAISELWNRGAYEDAIERARGYSRYGDPSQTALAIGPRRLVSSVPGLGSDIRIGNRDSLYGCSFDRLNNGWLFASFPAWAGDRTYIYSYRSTDNGETWAEMAQIQWNHRKYVRATAAVCHGDYLVVFASVKSAAGNLALVGRISAETGQMVLFPGDTMLIVAMETASGDTFVEFAAASSEDTYPGWEVYLFGRTWVGALKCARADSSCRMWQSRATGISSLCDNGLDCSYNAGYRSKYVWASWLRIYSGDSAWLCHGYFQSSDSVFHYATQAGCFAQQSDGFLPTAVSAYHDTVAIAFLLRGLKEVGLWYMTDCETGGWNYTELTDTWVTRDGVEIGLRRGGGCAAAYRSHAIADRDVLFRHAPQVGGPYSEPDTVSEHMPDPTVRIRLEKIAADEYGLVWVSINDTPVGAAYFDRATVPGVAEARSPQTLPLGLRARPRPGGVRLEFDNAAAGRVRLRMYDPAARLVLERTGYRAAGQQTFEVSPPRSGVYFALVEAGGRRAGAAFTFAR